MILADILLILILVPMVVVPIVVLVHLGERIAAKRARLVEPKNGLIGGVPIHIWRREDAKRASAREAGDRMLDWDW